MHMFEDIRAKSDYRVPDPAARKIMHGDTLLKLGKWETLLEICWNHFLFLHNVMEQVSLTYPHQILWKDMIYGRISRGAGSFMMRRGRTGKRALWGVKVC